MCTVIVTTVIMIPRENRRTVKHLVAGPEFADRLAFET